MVLVAACGGKSRRTENTGAPATNAEAGAPATSVDTGAGGADASPACVQFRELSDALTSCQELFGATDSATECPADFASAVAAAGWAGPGGAYVRVGCGLTSIVLNAGFFGDSYTFDATGALVAYSNFGDESWGPCDAGQYQFGPSVDACRDDRDCALDPAATSVDAACLCACPATPPSDGIVATDERCVYRPEPGSQVCRDKLSEWDLASITQGPTHDDGGLISQGCGYTEVEWHHDDDDLVCVYDDEESLVGFSRTGPDACPGVSGWSFGTAFPECKGVVCAFGEEARPIWTPLCGTYPFFQ